MRLLPQKRQAFSGTPFGGTASEAQSHCYNKKYNKINIFFGDMRVEKYTLDVRER